MSFDEENFENTIFFFLFFQVQLYVIVKSNKINKINEDFLKAQRKEINNSFDQIGQKLPQLLFQEDNSRVIYFISVSLSNEISVQKFS